MKTLFKKVITVFGVIILLTGVLPLVASAAAPASTGNWNNIRTYLCNYSSSSNIQNNITKFTNVDMVILDGSVPEATLTQLKTLKPSLFQIGYISIGETATLLRDSNNNVITSYYQLDSNGNPIQNPVWGGYYTNPSSASWQQYVLGTLLPEVYNKGFDGVFLDTVDDAFLVDTSRDIDFRSTAPGMVSLIQQIKSYNTAKKVIINRGYNLFGGVAFGENYDISPYVDGVKMESVNSTWASDYPNADGTYNTNYHQYPEGSQSKIYSRNAINKFNMIRYQYNDNGTVKKDSSGLPLKSSNFFHVFALDYVYDEDDVSLNPPTTIMQDNINYEWPLGLVSCAGRSDLGSSPYYDWVNEVTLPSSSNWASNLDIPSLPVIEDNAQDTIDNFSSNVSKWYAIAGSTQPGSDQDSAVLTRDTSGGVNSAKLTMTVQGTKAWQNYAAIQSVDWFVPENLSNGFLKFQIKLSTPLDANKRLQLQIKDSYKDYLIFDITSQVSTSWTTIRLDLNNDGTYYPGWDGMDDGFHQESIKNILFQVVNNQDNCSDYTGSLYLANIISNEDSMPYPDDWTSETYYDGLIDDFSDGTSNWAVATSGTGGSTASITADTSTFAAVPTARLTLSIAGTTAWADGATLQSTEWFTPVNFNNRNIYFKAAVSQVLAGANKSMQFQIIDVNNNARVWDVTSQLASSTLSTVSINPFVGGTEYNQPGSTFDLSKIISLKFVIVNTLNNGGSYNGNIWFTAIKALRTLPAPDSATGLFENFTYGKINWSTTKTGSYSNSCRLTIDSTTFPGTIAGRLAYTVSGNVANTDSVILKSIRWYNVVDFSKRVLMFDAKLSGSLANTNKSIFVYLNDSNGNTRCWDITSQLSTTALSTVILNIYDAHAVTTGSFQVNSIKSINFVVRNTQSGSSSYTGTLWLANMKAPALF